MPLDEDQRVREGLVSVAGRIRGRPLQVRVVVGRAQGHVDHPDAELREVAEEGVGAVVLEARGRVVLDAEAVVPPIGGGLAPAPLGAGAVGDDVVERDAHADLHAGDLALDGAHDLGEEPRTVLEGRAAVGARAARGAEELVEQVAVAGLHVDEVEARRRGRAGGDDVAIRDRAQLVVGQQGLVPACARVEQGIARGGPRRGRPVGPGPASRVGELQADGADVLGDADLAPAFEDLRAQGSEVLGGAGLGVRAVGEVELVRVGAPVGADGEGLAAPDERRAAASEAPPATQGQLARPAVLGAVPPLHRMHREAIGADAARGPLDGLAERASRALELVVERDVEAELLDVSAHRRGCPMGSGELELQGAATSDASGAGRRSVPKPWRSREPSWSSPSSMRRWASEVKRSGWRWTSCARSSGER